MSGLAKDVIWSFLPQSPPQGGALPLWILTVSVLAAFNTVQNFVSTKLTRRVYSNKPHEVSPLAARLFAVWTALSGALRFYAAYNIQDKSLYDLALISYALVVAHYVSETFVFRTAKISGAVLSPMIVGTTSLVWMIQQRDHYLSL